MQNWNTECHFKWKFSFHFYLWKHFTYENSWFIESCCLHISLCLLTSSFFKFWISCLSSAKFDKDTESSEIMKAHRSWLSSEHPLGGCAERVRPCQQLWEGEAATWVHPLHIEEFTREADIIKCSNIWRFSIRALNTHRFKAIGKQPH